MRKPVLQLSRKKLTAMAEDATLDCYNPSEQAVGWLTMIEEHLKLPFETEVLGMPVSVVRVDMTDGEEIVVVCRRGRYHQTVPILDLPLSQPFPAGAEWIEAYRHWVGGC